jgi:hypothetical protein
MFQKVLSPFQRTLFSSSKPAAPAVPPSHLILEARPPTLPAKVRAERLRQA